MSNAHPTDTNIVYKFHLGLGVYRRSSTGSILRLTWLFDFAHRSSQVCCLTQFHVFYCLLKSLACIAPVSSCEHQEYAWGHILMICLTVYTVTAVSSITSAGIMLSITLMRTARQAMRASSLGLKTTLSNILLRDGKSIAFIAYPWTYETAFSGSMYFLLVVSPSLDSHTNWYVVTLAWSWL